MPTIHLIIKGKVQGVFYRASTKKTAIALSVTGWVKNKDNGDVEALVTGTETQLKEFIEWCKRGPKGAEVKEVIETEQKEISFNSFSVEH